MEIKNKTTGLVKLSREIKKWSKELGFNNVGITDIELRQHEKYLERWLKRDFQGEMEYMKIHGKKRSRPEKLFKGTKRNISVSIVTEKTTALNKNCPKFYKKRIGYGY